MKKIFSFLALSREAILFDSKLYIIKAILAIGTGYILAKGIPVAIFTCIYMTQFVQHDLLGNPSIWLTFRLRIIALGFGIFVAIIFNYIFSFLYYKKIAFKRLEFAKMQVLSGLEYTINQLLSEVVERKRDYISIFSRIFNDIDMVYSNIGIMIEESKYSFKHLEPQSLKSIQKIMAYFRDINHLAYDINFAMYVSEEKIVIDKEDIKILEKSINRLKYIDFTKENVSLDKDKKNLQVEANERVLYDINSIKNYVDLIIGENI